MSLSKREFERQETPLVKKLAQIRFSVETALRATDEGSLDMPTVDCISLNLHDALRLLHKAEDEASPQLPPDADADDFDDPDCDERNW